MEDHQSDRGKRIFDSKRTYFDNEHTFLLSGHGTEIIRPGLRDRFELDEGEYCAISNSVGELGVTYAYYIIDFLKKRANKIKIPYNDTIINDPKLGFIDSIEKIDKLDPEEKYVDIDYFKLYRPRIDDTNNRVYKYTVPNLNYYPVAIFLDNLNLFKEKGIGNNITYKGVNYINKNIQCVDLRNSGIISRKNKVHDIPFNLYKIFKNRDEFDKNVLHLRFNEIPKNNNKAFINTFSNIHLQLSVPEEAWYKPIKNIIADKDTDPLSYDFLQMLIDSFENSILTFDDVCLLALCRILVWNDTKKKTPLYTKIAKKIYKFMGKSLDSKSVKEKKISNNYDLADDIFINILSDSTNILYKKYLHDVTIGQIQSAFMKLETVYEYLKLKINYNKSNPIMVIPVICRSLLPQFPSSEKTIRKYRALSRPAATKKKTATVKSKTLKQSKAKSH
jgi:hypothetical protein